MNTHRIPLLLSAAVLVVVAAVLVALAPRRAEAQIPSATTLSGPSVEALTRRLQEDERRLATLEAQVRTLQERVFPRSTNTAIPVAQSNTLESRLAAVERRLSAVEGTPHRAASTTDLATLEAKVRHLEAKVRKLEK